MNDTSIVICAYTMRRWDQLRLAVDSARRQRAHEVILVVDHNEELFDKAILTWGDSVRVLANTSVQGLSGARNTALDWAEGNRIAFLDDDAYAEDDWLQQLTVPFYTEPNVVAVGGTALPIWPTGQAPTFMPRDLYWVIGCSFDGQATKLEEVRNIMGCSMLFNTATLRGINGFNTETGRVGTLPLGAEETEACIRISEQDPTAKIFFQPAAIVHHHVSEDRVRFRYMTRRGFYEGISKAYIASQLRGKKVLGTEQSYAIGLLKRTAGHITHARFDQAYALVATLSATVTGYLYGKMVVRAKGRAKGAAVLSPAEVL